MNSYIVSSPFTVRTPVGNRVMKKGEAYRLSSSQAVPLISKGLVVDSHVGLDILTKYETRVKALVENVGLSLVEARADAESMVQSCLKRHESLKSSNPPSHEFLALVETFNATTQGKPYPINKESASTGVGEWAGYKCNIGKGCSHGCLYCYAERMAVRFQRVEDAEAWRLESIKELSTAACRRHNSQIMFPTTHDITPVYLPAYRYHLFNMLKAGNQILVVTKPHQESIKAICAELSAYRDQITFRFTIGSHDEETMKHWEPGAPSVAERIVCLKFAFEQGYTTSVSAEPMLSGKEDAVQLYHLLEPYITQEVWFGKINNIGGLRGSQDPKVAERAKELLALQCDQEILELVALLEGKPKVRWKDSIKVVMEKTQLQP